MDSCQPGVGRDLQSVARTPWPGSHLSSPASSCPVAFPRCGGRSATAACARTAPGPSSSACARVWASTAGLTRSPVSAPGCSHQTTAALGTGQKATVTPGSRTETHSQESQRSGPGRGGPRTLSARDWGVTEKLLSLHSQGSTPANCQQTPCPVVSQPPNPQGYPSRFSLNFKHV